MNPLHKLVTFVLTLCLAGQSSAAEPFRYPDGRHGNGELKYVNGLPVLLVQGTPEEMAQQMATLTMKAAGRLFSYPKEFLRQEGMESTWPALVLIGKSMLGRFPDDYRRELEAGAKASGIDRDLMIVANTMFDIKKLAGCSTLIVEPNRSATGAPLFGRNLDFPTLGFLQDYSLVIVVRPAGKHAFAAIGFPGLIGCLSGINDAGLALATLEVQSSRDGSSRFDPTGTPYALCYRRILEECTSVDEAEKMLRSMRRTTMMNLAVCDRTGGAVFEMTPRSVVVRRPQDGICPCTNHFRSKELATNTRCRRYDALETSQRIAKLGLADIAAKLDAANQGRMTLQTMIFEPVALKLHLAIGPCPSSRLPLQTLDLTPYFPAAYTRK
jgi:isopenicillin-N N-acyltransferase like protein